MKADEIVHIAGAAVRTGPYLRQRCSWCGAALIDVDLRQYPHDDECWFDYPTWTPSALIVSVGDRATFVVRDQYRVGDELPEASCMGLDPAVTA